MSTETWTPVKVRGGGAPAGAPGGPPSGTTTSSRGFSGWASKNKLVLGAGAAGVVVVLALLTKGRGGDSSTPTGTTVSGTTAGQNVGAYDSSASDVYNAIQPEVAALRDLIENWQAQQVPVPGGATSDVTTPGTQTNADAVAKADPMLSNGVSVLDALRYGSAVQQGATWTAGNVVAAEQASGVKAPTWSGQSAAQSAQTNADLTNTFRSNEVASLKQLVAQGSPGGLSDYQKQLMASAKAAGTW